MPGLTRRLMRAIELIERKRDGGKLTAAEIDHVSHEEVLKVADRAGKRLADLIKGVVAKL